MKLPVEERVLAVVARLVPMARKEQEREAITLPLSSAARRKKRRLRLARHNI